MGQGTAVAVLGVSLCPFGLAFGELGGLGLFVALLAGIIGIAVSAIGVAPEHEAART